MITYCFFFFSSRRRHTRCGRDWSSDVCSSDLFQYASILSLAAPIGVLWILWKMGLDNDIPFLEVLNALIKEAPQSLLYMLIFIIIRSEERRVGKECIFLFLSYI